MKDTLIRGITRDGFIKIAAVETKNSVEKARNIHKTLPLATAALGRTLSAAALMGDELKAEHGSVTLRIQGGGPLGAIIAVADSNGNMRGYLQNPALELPKKPNGKLDVSAGVGRDGLLTVIKDFGAGEPFLGKVELVSGEIAEDIAAYYVISEQVPTVCALGVLVDTDQSVLQAGGYLISLLPGAGDGLIDVLEARIQESPSITTLLAEHGGIEAAVMWLLDGFGLEIIERHEVDYICKCSEQKVENALRSMGKEELASLIEEEGRAEVSCQFCDNVYTFEKERLTEIFKTLE